jgi:hypothetical protein
VRRNGPTIVTRKPAEPLAATDRLCLVRSGSQLAWNGLLKSASRRFTIFAALICADVILSDFVSMRRSNGVSDLLMEKRPLKSN